MTYSPYDEAALLTLLRSDDQKAFEELYGRFAPRLLTCLMEIIQNQAQSEDLLQDSFIKIWRHLPQYDPLRGRLFTWMLRITRNVAFTHLKLSRRAEQRIDDFDYDSLGAVTPSYYAVGLDHWIKSTLGPHHRQLIDLVYLQGYTRQEVADQFGLPLGTVKSSVHQAIKRLRNSESAIGRLP
ncbi:RNA polymerase sigma factor [Spirosoma validum]|uniref:Sigma-70 family RNA polymerase sigma factor n=1 Tax=Spirosoma validum TaxID=2771355 RepID=A0A927B8G8_9BACT|nr:sigma-70 family RNA polymerase sigma factor [Spirosoma validum]MBD2757141.1 sigma-70 family RNA polymerase sigma factor [Spirosoma validum]